MRKKHRHWGFTVWFLFIIGISLFNIMSTLGQMNYIPNYVFVLSIIESLFAIVGITFLFMWKKKGFFLIVTAVSLSIIHKIIISIEYDVSPISIASNIVGFIVFFKALKVGKNPIWNQLDSKSLSTDLKNNNILISEIELEMEPAYNLYFDKRKKLMEAYSHGIIKEEKYNNEILVLDNEILDRNKKITDKKIIRNKVVQAYLAGILSEKEYEIQLSQLSLEC